MTVSLVQDLYQGRVNGSAVPWQAGATMVAYRGDMAAEDASSPANAGTFGLLGSFDGGKSFGYLDSGQWQGATTPRGPNYPGGTRTFQAGQATPSHVLIFWDLPNSLSCGGSVSFS